MVEGGLRVTVHLDEGAIEHQNAVLRNISNLLADLGSGCEVELVAHGPGITVLLRDQATSEIVNDLRKRGVGLCACGNTLKGQEIETDRLLEGAVVVSSGLGHLVRRQYEGWAYVRP